jgi:hypothetical protein
MKYWHLIKTTTHEPCLYCCLFKGKQILICRQVDDMLIAGEDMSIVRNFAEEISKHLKVTIGDKPSTHYNGLDILQSCDGIKLSCGTYIRKLQKRGMVGMKCLKSGLSRLTQTR